MAKLFAVTYSDPDQAKNAIGSIEWSDFDRLIDVKAACRITKEDGEFKVHPHGQPVAGKATLGGALGLLVGGLFAIPVVGIAAGAALGARKARGADLGIDEEFVAAVSDSLESGEAAIVVLFDDGADTAKAALDLAQFGGTVRNADLAPDQLDRFQRALDQANQ